MSWWDDFVDGVTRFFDWLGSDKTRETVEGIIQLVVLIAGVIEKFNAPLTGQEKRELVRLILRFCKYATAQQVGDFVQQITRLKATGDLDTLESWELDKLVGDGLAVFVHGKRKVDVPDESGLRGSY